MREISVYTRASRLAFEGGTQPPVECIPGVVSAVIKRLGLEADHALSSSVEFKIHEAIPPLHYTFL
jgi:hypothetical protein